MSANLDLVRSIYADWERGDYSSNTWADPEIEFAFVGGPAPGSWAGVAAMAEAMRDWLSAWEEFHGVGREYRELATSACSCSWASADGEKPAGLRSRKCTRRP